MPSLRDRAVSTFDGKDKSKTCTHLQSFEDFVDRQKEQTKISKKLKNVFLMTDLS